MFCKYRSGRTAAVHGSDRRLMGKTGDNRLHRPWGVEELEARWLLAGVPVPTAVNPATAAQTLWAADTTEWNLQNPATGAQLYRFAVDGPGYSDLASFHLIPAATPPVVDAAIALFDSSGNRIASVDADPLPLQPGAESLTAELVSGEIYVLGLFFATGSPPGSFDLNVQPGPQVVNTPVSINPSNGMTTFVANAGEDSLTSPTDVDYYPLDLKNGGSSGSVIISPLGLNGEVFATLYRRGDSTEPWRPVNSAGNPSGGAVQLDMVPESGRQLTDAEFMLSVSTENFDGGPGGYQIQVAAAAVLAPTTIDPAQATGLLTLKPISPDLLGEDISDTVPVGQANLYRFRAVDTGTVSLSVNSSANTVVSIYDETGNVLQEVFTGSLASPVSQEFSVVAGTAYHVRVQLLTGNTPGTFSLSLRGSYTPQPLDISGGPTTVATLIGPTVAGAAYRVATTSTDDVFVVQVQSGSPAAYDVIVVGAGDGEENPFQVEKSVAAGEALVLPLDISNETGPFDVFIQGTSSTATATIKLGLLDIPTTLVKGVVPDASLNTNSGNVSFSRSTSMFGEMTGAQFVELQRGITQPIALGARLTADGQNGARLPNGPVPILAHYRQIGSTLRLQSFEIANENNVAEIDYPTNLPAQTFHAVVGFNASIAGAGTVAYDLAGEQPQFVGIQMVPDLSDPQPPPHRFVFAARNVQLATELDRDLWKTILPYNILNQGSYPEVAFKPSESSMQIQVTVLDTLGVPLGSRTMTQQLDTWELEAPPGQNASYFKNQTLHFVVEPVAGSLGNGIYTLEMKVNTTNPLPYLVEEPAFQFFGTNPTGTPVGTSMLPNEPIVDIVQDPTGFGYAIGSFTSSTPHQPPNQMSPGAIDVYRFWATTPGPVTVRTIGLSDTNNEITINTNLRIYREYLGPGNSTAYLDGFQGEVENGLGDWFPADRELIDDQTYVNYFEAIAYSETTPGSGNDFYLTGGGNYYVVVKNEQGTLGDYRIEVDTAAFPLLGSAATYDLARKGDVVQLPWNTGTNTQASFSLPYVEGVNRFVGYVPLQLPEFHNGTLQIVGQANSGWNLHLYDESFEVLSGTVSHVGSPSHTEGTFMIPQGMQRVYLRVHELGENPNAWASFTASVGLVQPFGIPAPPATLSATPSARMLPTTPDGDTPTPDGQLHPFADSMTSGNQTKRYAFQAQPGHVSVKVAPERNMQGVADVELVWGIYVNGQRLTWNHTLNALPSGDSEVQLFLPDIRPPVDPTDYDYDLGPYYDIVVHCQTISSPINGGDFSIVVQTSSDLSMRNGDLVLPPTQFFSSVMATKEANDWSRFFVPHGASALTLDVDVQNGIDPGGLKFFADIYDNNGELVFTQTISSDPINTGATFALNSLQAGQGYFLRTGYRDDVKQSVTVKLSAGLFKNLPGNGFSEPLSTPLDLSMGPAFSRLKTNPFGHADDFPSGNGEYRQVFWAGESGPATFVVSVGTLDDHYIALYRLNRSCGVELCGHDAYLVDFANGASYINGKYTLNTFVEPGAYLLRTVQFGETGSAHVEVGLPAYITEDVVLEPNSGANAVNAMRGVGQARDGYGQISTLQEFNPAFGEEVPEGLRTSIFRVVAPPGAQGDVIADMVDLQSIPLGSTAGRFWVEVLPQLPLGLPMTTDAVPHHAIASWNAANPSEIFWTGVYRQELVAQNSQAPSPIGAAVDFLTPESGEPDLVIEPLSLSPDKGQTIVGITIRNRGFGSAFATHSLFELTDKSTAGPHTTEHIILEYALGPRTTRPRSLTWVPNSIDDTAQYTADYDELLDELREDNNAANDTIIRVDQHAPSLTLELLTPSIDQNSALDTFGRYIAKVPGVISDIKITVTDGDGPGHLYKTTGSIPWRNQQFVAPIGQFFAMDAQSQLVMHDFDFGSLLPTASNNPNEFRLVARDIYGVPSTELVRKVQVMKHPGWLLPVESDAITFNPATKKYDIKFRNQLINIGPTSLSDLLGVTIPFVGGLNNRFLLEMGADATASLDPTQPVSASAFARAEINVLGDEILNTTYQLGAQTPSNLVSISGTIDVNSLTLDADYLDVTFALNELPLLSVASPKIPLFAYGVPGVAAIQASLQFSFSASIESKATLAMDLNTPPHQPANVGFASPTFIAANLDAGLSISGDITFLGMDLASLVGTIHLVISPAYGLDSPPSQFVPFNQFTNHDCTEVTGYMYGEIGAEILGIEVYSFDLPSVQIPFPNGCNVVGHRPGNVPHTIAIPGGDDVIGELMFRAGPQVVIDPSTQNAVYTQLVDVDPGPAVRQNLAWSRRQNGSWTPLMTLPQATGHVTNPVLGRYGPGAVGAAVVMYNSLSSLGDPAQLTRNQFMTGQELRYRFFNGNNWSTELALTNDSLYDFNHAMAFNDSGQGAVAWVKNGTGSPIDPQGRFDRAANEIQVAVWNPLTRMFGVPQSLTSNAVGDGQPAVYTAPDGKTYVVWIEDTEFDVFNHVVTGNQVMYSVYDPGPQTWSAAAPLAINGFPSAGTIDTLQIGSEGGGRIQVLVGQSEADQNLMVTSRLYSRSSTQATFAAPQPLAIVAENMNFSDLRVVNGPDGALLAYWMSGNGQSADVMASTLGPLGTGPVHWSRPFALSSTDGNVFPMAPSLAVDTNGQYQLVYELREAPESDLHLQFPGVDPMPILAGHPDGDPTFSAPLGGGVGSSSYQLLPEFGFQQDFRFAEQDFGISGQTARGSATVINRGLVGDGVQVQYVQQTSPGNYTLLFTDSIHLSPGQAYSASFDYPVGVGTRKYGIRLISASGQEMIGLGDNVSTDDLTGRRDIAVTGITLSNPTPVAGESVTVNVEVRNLSTMDVGSFRVELYDGNRLWPFYPTNLIGSTIVNQLSPQQAIIQSFPWTVPAGGGRIPLFAAADLAGTLEEVTHSNNTFSRVVMVLPEVSVQSISASALNYSGVDNVQVDAIVTNLGKSNAHAVTVSLYHSLDNETFEFVDSLFFQAIAAGQSTPLTFLAPGLVGRTGENRYRVVATYADPDPTNQLQQTLLILQSAADLSPSAAHLNTTTPTQGEPATMIVDIQNLGIATADQVMVEVYGTNTDLTRYLLGSQIIPQLDPLSAVNLQIPLNTSQVKGLVEFCVEVDGQQEILELTDLNNVSCFRLPVLPAAPPQVTRFVRNDGMETFDQLTSLTFEFDADVSASLDISDLQIVDQITGTTIDFGALRPEDLVWDPLAQTARWDLSRLIIAPTFYNLILDARSIFDISGTTLDGDGNGVPGDDYVQTVLVALQGDASLDGCVDGSDFIIWNSHKFSNGSWLQGDFNHDSIVDGSDFVLWNRFKFTCLAATTAFPGTTAEHVGIADLSSVVGSPAISPMEEHHDLPTRRDSVFDSIKPVHHVVALEAINRPWRECDLPQAAWGRSKVMRSLELNQSHSSEDEYAEFTRLVDCVFGS